MKTAAAAMYERIAVYEVDQMQESYKVFRPSRNLTTLQLWWWSISSSAQCCQAALQIDDSPNVERAAEPSAAAVFCSVLLLNSQSTAS